MTSKEIANKWTMNRYRGPHSSSGMGMADKEFFDLLTDDISDYAKQLSIGFAEWAIAKFQGHYRYSESGMEVEQVWWPRPMTLDKENAKHYTTSEIYQLYLNSIK